MNVSPCSTITLDAIREHYDVLSPFYHRFWGEHIHHGYWENGESLPEAQTKLIARLATFAAIPAGAHVFDVGCGIGGSALWLARELGCSVLGITISSVQVAIATQRAAEAGVADRVRFEVRDANRLESVTERFDAIWSVECTEHLFDKPRFFQNCFRLLRSGGRLAVCNWLAEPRSPAEVELVNGVRQAMLCPSFGSMTDHLTWLRTTGFESIRTEDDTRRVEKTWDRALEVLSRPEVAILVGMADGNTRRFAESFPKIREAYASGAMTYGLFAARKARAEIDPLSARSI